MDKRLVMAVVVSTLMGAALGFSLSYIVFNMQVQNAVSMFESEIERMNSRDWQVIETFRGISDQTTAPFLIEGQMWRISWFATAATRSSYAFFSLIAYESGKNRAVYMAKPRHSSDFTLMSVQSEIEYIIGKGNFYIQVFTANLDNWTIIVESYQ